MSVCGVDRLSQLHSESVNGNSRISIKVSTSEALSDRVLRIVYKTYWVSRTY